MKLYLNNVLVEVWERTQPGFAANDNWRDFALGELYGSPRHRNALTAHLIKQGYLPTEATRIADRWIEEAR